MNAQYQIIVVGLGGIGSAALYHVAKQCKSSLGIEQFHVPLTRSTHGGSRITRLANGDGDVHTQLALRARELWKDAQQQTDYDLLHQWGGVIVSNKLSGSFNHYTNC